MQDKEPQPELHGEPVSEGDDPIEIDENGVANLPPAPVGDETPPHATKPTAAAGRLDQFKDWCIQNKKLSIPAALILVLLILAAIPPSRNALAGTVIKKDISIKVEDATTHTPVSGATVSLGGNEALTDAAGKVTLRGVKPGAKTVTISKKYYKPRQLVVAVPILKAQTAASADIVATGRQVSINVTNYVDGTNLSGVDITIAGTTAKTDKQGHATVVVPATADTQKGSFSLDGYNDLMADIKVSQNEVAKNTVKLTPAGKIYFFSKRTGRLDLMKSNLDGSDTETVLAGTGNEQVNQASISQSADWKYIALSVRRDASSVAPQLYVLSAADDKLLSVDGGNANFSMIGWAGDNLIYNLTRSDLNQWDPGKSKLKSYDATSGKITLLDQTAAVADSQSYETYASTFICGSTVVYAKNWYTNYYYSTDSGHQPALYTIGADGQNHKTIATYNAGDYVNYIQHGINDIYIAQQSGNTTNFFDYSVNTNSPKQINISQSDFYAAGNTFYISPSGNQTMWSEQRDGKNAVIVGDQDGNHSNVVATLTDYVPLGWFGDKYLILTKSSSEIYIMSAKGGTPQLINSYQATTNYY